MLVCSLVLVNIIIAVLLDEFLTTMGEHRAKTARLAAKAGARPLYLDPLMELLSKFQSMDDLVGKVDLIFNRLDADGSRALGFTEMSQGLHVLIPKMYLSLENMMDLQHGLLEGLQEDLEHQVF
jgi:hypothetical protein